MGKVTTICFSSRDAWFYSNDHLPYHFHLAKPGKWEIRVYFLKSFENMFEIKYGKGPSGREKKTIFRMVDPVRENLLREWEGKVSCM